MTGQKFDAQVLTAREGEMLDALSGGTTAASDVPPLVLEANRQLARPASGADAASASGHDCADART